MGWIFYDEPLSTQWDELVKRTPQARFVHLIGFKKVVEKVYHLKPCYLSYIDKGEIFGLFPSFFHQSFFFGKKIISQPFCEYGGVLFHPEVSLEKKLVMIQEFCLTIKKILNLKSISALEMRHPLDILENKVEIFKSQKLFFRSWLKIEAPEVFWKKLDPKERNIIRKAQAYDLKVEIISDDENLKEKFYPLYLRTMKRLGSPAHPFIYFLSLFQCLKDYIRIFIISFKGRPVAGLIAWTVGQTSHVTDLVSDERFFWVKPNDLAIWEFLNWAYYQGVKIFDFGPIRYRGQEIFKKKWLMTIEDYYYVYLFKEAKKMAKAKNIFSDSLVISLGSFLWKTFMPLTLNAWVGQYMRRQIAL
ncbi:MAG: GNAT family N-acetyltransferase [Candidatus Aminicenantes bacterium]|nr:GNAT family N-acetyltransferase [Candidatus Aminicenantes bacterium]